MKKFLMLCAALLCPFGVMHAQEVSGKKGQWYFGVGGGFHASKMKFSDIDEKVFPSDKFLNGGVFSIFAEYDFGKDLHFAVRPEFSFLRRGGKLTEIEIEKDMYDGGRYEDVRYTLKSRYWDIRVPVMYQFCKPDATFRPYVFIAPVLGFSTRGEIGWEEELTDNSYSGYDMELTKANMASVYFAGMVGVGAKYQFDLAGNTCFLGLEASYEYGFTDTYGGKEKDGTAIVESGEFYNVYDVQGTRKFSGFEIQATLGIPFSVFKKKKPAPAPAPEPVVVAPVKQEVKKEAPKPEKPCYTLEEIIDMMARNESVEGKTICAIDAITFDFGKSTIKSESHEYLDKLASTLIRTNAKIEVKGHTDNVGTEDFNMKLSKERAQAVVEYLVKKGVSRNKLTYSYYGMSKPLASNDTEEGRTINRRVEFEILK